MAREARRNRVNEGRAESLIAMKQLDLLRRPGAVLRFRSQIPLPFPDSAALRSISGGGGVLNI